MSLSQTLGSAGRFLHLLNENKPIWMGILNITPDSFSDGGCYVNTEAAAVRAIEMVRCGARMIDVGGASTRPGSEVVSADVEAARVLPVLKQLRDALPQAVLISLDTYSPCVALKAAQLELIDVINDVYAGRRTEECEGKNWTTIDVAAAYKLAWVGMHMKGELHTTMQHNPVYTDCVSEVVDFLKERITAARHAGVQAIVADPGIGFGKRVEDNLALLSKVGLEALLALRVPLLVGLSRKRFLTVVHPELAASAPIERDVRSKEWEKLALSHGVKIIRTHRLPEEVIL